MAKTIKRKNTNNSVNMTISKANAHNAMTPNNAFMIGIGTEENPEFLYPEELEPAIVKASIEESRKKQSDKIASTFRDRSLVGHIGAGLDQNLGDKSLQNIAALSIGVPLIATNPAIAPITNSIKHTGKVLLDPTKALTGFGQAASTTADIYGTIQGLRQIPGAINDIKQGNGTAMDYFNLVTGVMGPFGTFNVIKGARFNPYLRQVAGYKNLGLEDGDRLLNTELPPPPREVVIENLNSPISTISDTDINQIRSLNRRNVRTELHDVSDVYREQIRRNLGFNEDIDVDFDDEGAMIVSGRHGRINESGSSVTNDINELRQQDDEINAIISRNTPRLSTSIPEVYERIAIRELKDKNLLGRYIELKTGKTLSDIADNYVLVDLQPVPISEIKTIMRNKGFNEEFINFSLQNFAKSVRNAIDNPIKANNIRGFNYHKFEPDFKTGTIEFKLNKTRTNPEMGIRHIFENYFSIHSFGNKLFKNNKNISHDDKIVLEELIKQYNKNTNSNITIEDLEDVDKLADFRNYSRKNWSEKKFPGDINSMAWSDAEGFGEFKPFTIEGNYDAFKSIRKAGKIFDSIPRGYSLNVDDTSYDSEMLKLLYVIRNAERYGRSPGQISVEPLMTNSFGNAFHKEQVRIGDILNEYRDILSKSDIDYIESIINRKPVGKPSSELINILEEKYNIIGEKMAKSMKKQWDKILQLDPTLSVDSGLIKAEDFDESDVIYDIVHKGKTTPRIYRPDIRIHHNRYGGKYKFKYGGTKENKVFKLKGGVAIPLDDKKKLFYLSGAKHEQGGIDVTPELEAESGEVVKINPKSIKVVTAQKIMGGKSPAELVVDASSTGKSDAVFNKVFNYQEEFKDRVGLNDDGTKKAKFGKFINSIKNKVKAFMGSDYKFNKIYNNGDEVYKELNNIVSSATSDKDLETKLNDFWDSIKDNVSIGYDTFKGIKQDIEHYKKYPYSSIVLTRDRVDYDKKKEFNKKLSIPVDQNKIVTLRNAGKSNNTTLSTNLLDSLAYRAGRAKADTVRMLGIPAQETGLGKFEGTTYMSPASIRINDVNYPLYRGEYAEKFMRDGEITPSELMNNHNYYTNSADQEAIGAISRKHNVGHDASKGHVDAAIDYNEVDDNVEKSFKETFNYTTNKRKKENINIHPLEDAYKLDKLGIYNTGMPNHNELVEARGRELWQSPEIKQWWNTSGKSFYEKGKSETKRLGGNMKKKAVFGLKDVSDKSKTTLADAYEKGRTSFENKVVQLNPNNTLAPRREFDVTVDNVSSPLTGYDWANIGVNALGSLLTFGHALGNAKVNPLKYSDPIPYTGAKLKTRVNINSAKQKIKRATDKINDSINKNTSNSTVALNRLRNTYLNERDALVDLYTNKENTENQLINKDILNWQSARFKTISDYNTVRRENEKNRYLAERETQENVNNAISGFVQNIGNATSSIANTLEQRDQFDKNMKILGLAYPNLDVDRLNKVIRPTNVEKAERARKREKIRLIRKGIIKPSEI